ncbi:hypothetical protein AS034_03365 [[Bacillus] enclensis]|nr:hypothetical protein AS034_03365 [[Bacillus] enclensis]
MQTLKRAGGWCEPVWMRQGMDFRASKPKSFRESRLWRMSYRYKRHAFKPAGFDADEWTARSSQQRWHHGYPVLFIRIGMPFFYFKKLNRENRRIRVVSLSEALQRARER